MTIEERVEQLEAQVAQLTGEGDYTLLKSGETIDTILDGIETAAIYHGSETITVASGDIQVRQLWHWVSRQRLRHRSSPVSDTPAHRRRLTIRC